MLFPHWPGPLLHKVTLGQDLRFLPLLQKLGNPHLNMPPIIHVGGTNGKGSTVAMLTNIFESSGYKVSRYISPPLIYFNERIYISGRYISDDEIYLLLEECRIAAEALELRMTPFEGYTAAAFLAFSRTPADILILEVGVGGRLDPTNAAPNVIMSMITPISLEHTNLLGCTIEQIAAEKAGIIRNNTSVIISQQTEEVIDVLNDRALMLNAPTYIYEYDFICDIKLSNGCYDNFIYKSKEHGEISFPKPALHGVHQYVNAVSVIEAAMKLSKVFPKITEQIIKNSIATTFWVGRLQQIKTGIYTQILGDKFDIWVDGAHNISGARAVAAWIDINNNYDINILIIGLTKGRDCHKVLSEFIGKIDYVYAVHISAEPSSYPPEIIHDEAVKLGFDSKYFYDISDVVNDINKVHNAADNHKRIRLIFTGSLFLVGMVLKNSNLTTLVETKIT